VIHQRKKLFTLQEEHNDLLGLLAQQELELEIFRDSLEQYGGVEVVLSADDQVQQKALDKYGTYINFRRGDIDENDENSFDLNNFEHSYDGQDINNTDQISLNRRNDPDIFFVDDDA